MPRRIKKGINLPLLQQPESVNGLSVFDRQVAVEVDADRFKGVYGILTLTGTDIAIRELALLIKEIVGFGGEIRFNPAMPDGTPRKLLDVSRMTALGWKASTPLKQGLALTYDWFVANEDRLRQ